MSDIKIDNLFSSIQNYAAKNDCKTTSNKSDDLENNNYLSNISHSINLVRNITESSGYQHKVEQIAKEVQLQSYPIDADSLIEQLIAEEALLGHI